jgi:ATP-dependent Clp protease ATP-binding subunit ClpC
VFERFTPNARHVVVDAQQALVGLGHEQLTTEHLLYGLAVARTSFSSDLLSELGVDVPRVEALLVERYGRRTPPAGPGQVPFTPRAKRALEQATTEADALDHALVGTEHVLLGVTADPECGAVTALTALGAADVHTAALRKLGVDI